MKKLIVVASALALSACATVERATTVSKAQPAAGTYYCKKDRLLTEGDKLVCTWESNTNDACRAFNSVAIEKGKVASGPTDDRRCENGQWLVRVTTR